MSKSPPRSEGISVTHVVLQFILICGTFALWTSPLIQPVKIMVVLFHEMSHGLMALVTGGQVTNIVITPDEGGLCETEGGAVPLIVSAGYLGSMFFGGLLLYLSKFRSSVSVVYTVLTVLLAAAIFTVLRDPFSRTFATGLAGAFIFLGLVAPTFIASLFLQLLGTVSCLYSIFDIYGDVVVSGGVENDAQIFSDLTGVSPDLVGFVWLAISIVYFITVLRFFVLRSDASDPQPA